MHSIEFEKVYTFVLTGTFSFGDLTPPQLIDIFKDGRVASHLLEPQLVKWFPELRHVKGCRDHDHVNKVDESIKYDAKNFTKTSGLKFVPSKMIGTGRKFDKAKFHKEVKEKKMNYICCDIVDFPKVRVLFKRGTDLLKEYPTGSIGVPKRDLLFRNG
jgi:hypothetical protein